MIKIDFALLSFNPNTSGGFKGGYEDWCISKGYSQYQNFFKDLHFKPERLLLYQATALSAKNIQNRIYISITDDAKKDEYDRAVVQRKRITFRSGLNNIIPIQNLLSSNSVLDPQKSIYFKNSVKLPIEVESETYDHELDPLDFYIDTTNRFWILDHETEKFLGLFIYLTLRLKENALLQFVTSLKKPKTDIAPEYKIIPKSSHVGTEILNQCTGQLKEIDYVQSSTSRNKSGKRSDNLNSQSINHAKDLNQNSHYDLDEYSNIIIIAEQSNGTITTQSSNKLLIFFERYRAQFRRIIPEHFPRNLIISVLKGYDPNELKAHNNIFNANEKIIQEYLCSQIAGEDQYSIRLKYAELLLKFHIFKLQDNIEKFKENVKQTCSKSIGEEIQNITDFSEWAIKCANNQNNFRNFLIKFNNIIHLILVTDRL